LSRLVNALMRRMEHADTPRQIRALSWGLELATGYRAADLVTGQKAVSFNAGPIATGSRDDPDWYARHGYRNLAAILGGGYESYTGQAITPEVAFEAAAYYACIKIIAEDIGSLPFFPYERSEDGSRTDKAYGHWSYAVLHDMPNPEMSAGEFREALTGRALLGLDGFARIERTMSGKAVLWPIADDAKSGIRGQVTIDRNGRNQPVYIVKEGKQEERSYTQDKIFHLRGFTLDGRRGDDILQRAKHVLGIAAASQEYAGRFFAQDSSPGIILERPLGSAGLTADKVIELKQAWMKWHQGRDRWHEPGVLQDGTKAYRVDPDHQKLQMLETRQHSVVEIARLHRMPLHKLGDLTRATFSNIEQQSIEYVNQTLWPWRRRWEEAYHRCCLTPEERYWRNGRPRMYAEFSVEALLRGDFATQWDGFSRGLEKGVYAINDVRAWFNMNPVEGGDKHYVQLNMQDVNAAATTAMQEAGREAAVKAVVEILERKMLPAPGGQQ
jgi:HK97 family phage portal protein